MTRDQAKKKLKALKELAERGVGGEKDGALKMYHKFLEKYQIEEEEILEERVTLHWFAYKTELEGFLIAFYQGNNIYPDKTARCYQEYDGPEREIEGEELRKYKKAAFYSLFLDKRTPPRALIGEMEEEAE